MSKQIVGYKVLGAYDNAKLEEDVDQLIQKGWQPFCSPFNISGEICQPMVKYKEEGHNTQTNNLPLHDPGWH